MALSQASLNLDIVTLRQINVRGDSNAIIPQNYILESDGQGGTYWGAIQVNGDYAGFGVSSLSTVVSFGLSSIISVPNNGVSTISSIVAYGLSTLRRMPNNGVSSLSSIVSFGLSTIGNELTRSQAGTGVSSLSSIVSYGLSSVYSPYGASSLSSIVSYGLSSVADVALATNAGPGVSSLSSIVSYGLSTLELATINRGVSSLSSIVSYGLSTVYAGFLTTALLNPGVSSLSSMVSYGFSSFSTSISISIGTSSIYASSIYVSSSMGINCNTPSYTLDVNGSIQGTLASNTLGQFHSNSIGGTGILDASSPTPDTYVNSIFKLDNWLYENLVGKPPAPLSNTITNTKSNIQVTWTNPTLYSVGIFDNYIPNITSLYVTLSNPANTIYNYIPITTHINLPMQPSAVTGINFLNFGSYTEPTISNVNDTYYIYLTNTAIVAGDKYNVSVYFSNYNINTQIPINTLNYYGLILLPTGYPSPPQDLSAIYSTYSNVTFSWSPPTYTDSNDNTNDTPLSHYVLSTSNASNDTYTTRRYVDTGSPNDSRIIENTLDVVTLYEVTGLYPDNWYTGAISAKNTINDSYSISSNCTNSILTALPPAPPRSGTIAYLASYTFTNSSALVASNRSGPFTVFKYSSLANGLAYTITDAAIHTLSNPGVSNTDIMRIIASNTSGSNCVYPIFGFLDTNTAQTYLNNIAITRTAFVDYYNGTNGFTGFYQQGTFTVNFSQSFFPASATPYTVYITQSNQDLENITTPYTVYVDYLLGLPSISFASNYSTQQPPTTYINGVLSYTNTAVFYNYIGINNLGNYFLVNSSFGNYGLYSGSTAISGVINLDSTTTPIYTDLVNTQYVSGALPSNVYVYTSLTLNDTSLNTFTPTDPLTMHITAINLNGSPQPTTCNINYNGSNYYIDLPSIKIINAYSMSASTGARVTSGTGTINPTLYGSNFDQTQSLSTTYSNELQLLNGSYVTKAASAYAYSNYSNYYGNTFDYSGILSDGTMRYATFKYTMNCNNALYSLAARFTITYASGATQFPVNAGLYSGGISIQYIILDTNNQTPSLTNMSTVWLNGNLPYANGFKDGTTLGYAATVPGTGGGAPTDSFTSTNFTVGIRANSYNNITMYVKIGIPMNQPYSFTSCTFNSFS